LFLPSRELKESKQVPDGEEPKVEETLLKDEMNQGGGSRDLESSAYSKYANLFSSLLERKGFYPRKAESSSRLRTRIFYWFRSVCLADGGKLDWFTSRLVEFDLWRFCCIKVKKRLVGICKKADIQSDQNLPLQIGFFFIR
jgi:hypothetical protein